MQTQQHSKESQVLIPHVVHFDKFTLAVDATLTSATKLSQMFTAVTYKNAHGLAAVVPVDLAKEKTDKWTIATHPRLLKTLAVVKGSNKNFVHVVEQSDLGHCDVDTSKAAAELNEQQCVDVLLGAAEGVSALHAARLPHRSISAGNVFIFKSKTEASGVMGKIGGVGVGVVSGADEIMSSVRIAPVYLAPDAPKGSADSTFEQALANLTAFNQVTNSVKGGGKAMNLTGASTETAPTMSEYKPADVYAFGVLIYVLAVAKTAAGLVNLSPLTPSAVQTAILKTLATEEKSSSSKVHNHLKKLLVRCIGDKISRPWMSQVVEELRVIKNEALQAVLAPAEAKKKLASHTVGSMGADFGNGSKGQSVQRIDKGLAMDQQSKDLDLAVYDQIISFNSTNLHARDSWSEFRKMIANTLPGETCELEVLKYITGTVRKVTFIMGGKDATDVSQLKMWRDLSLM